MTLLDSLLMVSGAIVISSPIGWLILQAEKVTKRNNKKKNKSQAKRNTKR